MIKFEISIDNVSVSPQIVLPFFQKNPYPGGKKYSVDVHFDSRASLEKILKVYNLSNINDANWSLFFMYLTSIWPQKNENEGVLYFINSVEEAMVNQKSINFKGVCSTNLQS